jgi:hypothetical protein
MHDCSVNVLLPAPLNPAIRLLHNSIQPLSIVANLLFMHVKHHYNDVEAC